MSKNYIGGINSWGNQAQDKGHFYVTEDYFNNSLVFSGWTLVDLPDYQSPYMFNLMKADSANVYAVSNNIKHLIVNLDSYKAGIVDGLWAEQINTVPQADLDNIKEGQAFLLFTNN